MARVTVEDCLEVIPNRFSLVLITAERTRQLLKGSQVLIKDERGNKEIVTALREVAAGTVSADMSMFDENEALLLENGPSSDDLPPEVDDDDLPPIADDDDLPPPA